MRQIWNRDHQSVPYLQRFLAPDDPEPIYYFLPGEDTTANVRGATKRMHKEVPEARVAGEKAQLVVAEGPAEEGDFPELAVQVADAARTLKQLVVAGHDLALQLLNIIIHNV